MDEIKLKKLISDYKSSHPQVRNKTDKEIISIMYSDPKVKKEDVAQLSALLANQTQQIGDSCNFPKTAPSKVQTKSVIVKTQEGKNYNLNKTIELRINNVSKNLTKQEKSNGFIGKTWSGFKNLTGIGDSSDNVRQLLENERKLLNNFNSNVQKRPQIFKELTGLDYTPENLVKFIKGQIKLKSEIALNKYKEGQEMASDITGDIISGIAAVGIYSVAVAAAPFTGGASIALGVGAAALAGGLIKSGVKALDTVGTDKKYDSFGHDMITGAFSGVLAPVTGGLGGAAGKTIATRAGIQVLKHTGEKAAESGVKAILTNPAGYQYVGGSLLKRSLAIGTEMAVDGAAGGAVDTAFRTGVDQIENGADLNFNEIGMSAIQGGIGGLFIAPAIGGGLRGVGKVGNKLGKKIHTNQLEVKAFREEVEQKLLKRIGDVNSPKETELVGTIKNKITAKNKSLVEIMLQDESITNEQILSIINSLTKTTSLNPIMQIPTLGIITDIHIKNNSLRIKYAKNLLQNKNIANEQIPSILENLYAKNSKFLDTMIASENFDTQSISDILRNSYYYNQDGMRCFPKCRENLALKLINNKEFPDSYISDILGKTYSTNLKLLEKVCDTKDFPRDHISILLDNILYDRNGRVDYVFENNTGYKIKLTEQLLDDSNCPKNVIADIIGAIDSKQAKLFEQLYNDKNISKSEIASILHIQNGFKKGEKLSFAEKVSFLTNATTLESSTFKHLEKYNISSEKVNNLINSISLEMGMKKNIIEIGASNVKTLYKNFINNRGDIDRIITSFNPDKFSNGVPLKYPRQQFISDIENLLKNTNEAYRKEILNYFGITLSKGNFEGIPTIPKGKTLNFREELKPVIEKIKTKIENFTLKNESTIDDTDLKTVFDSLIKGCPEFATVIGKTQHGTHQYSVDVHTLKVLQNAINDPAYKTLNDIDKTALKFAILLHDIGKKCGTVDA